MCFTEMLNFFPLIKIYTKAVEKKLKRKSEREAVVRDRVNKLSIRRYYPTLFCEKKM